MIHVRPSAQTLTLLDALNADLRRIRSELTSYTPDGRMELTEARAHGLADKSRALRMSSRGERAAAQAMARADEAQNRNLTLAGADQETA